MADRLVDLILKNIDKDKLLQVQYERLLVEYTRSLFNVTDSVFDDGYRSLLRYADLLSISELEIHNNLAQQIIILLGQLFPNEEEVAIFKESVYQNVSNFASLEFAKAKNDIIVQHDFLRDVGNYTHQIINRIPDSDKIFFDTQRFALKDISASQYYSFSAPTSMGKTFVIINFIKNKLKENVSENFVIVVPTRALLSEIANKLINELKDYLGANCHKVITTMTAVQQDEKFIAVLTPERLYHSLLKQPEIEFKYLFIDEAHKISDKDKRSIIYYKILDMLKERPFVHIYFSSPVIPNPDIYLELTNFYNQDGNKVSGRSFRFSPVIQNKIYLDLNQKTAYVVNALSNQLVPCGNLLDGVSDKLGAVTRLGGKCNLIYVSSANKAVTYAMELCQRIGTCTNKIEPELNAIAKQIEQKIHKEYYLARMIRHGIAYHIGALPAEIRAKIESLLRKGLIKYCFCTSTLLEGVNVPADNLFVFDNKKGPSAMSTIDAFNLIGRAGRVTLNEMGNVYILIDDKRKQKYFDEVLLKPLPNQELLPQKALEKKHKKAIVSTLLQGKTNLIEAGEKYSDRGFTETSYEYATKCLNMLVHDICAKNDSYIVRDFRKDDILTPQNIIDIRRIFGEIVSKDDDINISALQKYSLYQAVSNTEISYPDNFDYHTCLSFLKKLSQIFNWPIYEKGTLGKGDRLNYYTVILLQWMEGRGLHEIIRGAISHYQEQDGKLVSYDPTYHLEKYNGSANHKNQVINEAMKDIEQIINYKFSMYFLRFSEAIIKIRGEKALINDWYEYVEYGTCNEQVIGLQKHGFLREQALLLTKNPYSAFVAYLDGQLKISSEIFEVSDEDMLETLGTVRINYPEIFVDGESE